MKNGARTEQAVSRERRKPGPGGLGAEAKAAQAGVAVAATAMDKPVAHLLLRLSGHLDENTAKPLFERVREVLQAAKPNRVLIDLRACSIVLTISDMHDLVKMSAAGFAGRVHRLALVVQIRDILSEKFFEPALTRRGIPTLVTASYDEAVDWLSASLRQVH